MTTAQRRSRASEAFFGRRHGKTIRPLQAAALATGLERYRLDLSVPAPSDLRDLFPVAVARMRVEIGFGGGERLRHAVDAEADTGFIGVEPFVNGMAKALAAFADRDRPNLRVYDDDAVRLLDWIGPGSLDGIDLFYPDPWPKRRHWKRRFVNATNLDRFARALKPGGMFRFVSDVDAYVNWTLRETVEHTGFDWIAADADDWRLPYPDWQRTRYEAKAFREGRTPCYLRFRRRDG